MMPSMFGGLDAQDEYELIMELGEQAPKLLAQHRASYITGADLDWIAAHGLNAVRVPVPHWVYGGYEPYIPCSSQVRWLMDAAHERGLKVLLDLHTAPGSQNGQDHSGRRGPVGWNNRTCRRETINTLRTLCAEFGNHPALLGIELLNEPHAKLPLGVLQSFYGQASNSLTPFVASDVRVVASDSFRPRKLRLGRMEHMTIDMHLYQAFGSDTRLTIAEHVHKARATWSLLIQRVSRYAPVIVGEWSLGLDGGCFEGMSVAEADQGMRDYASAQLAGFAAADGWFFWNYKTEADMPGWSYRAAVEKGWLPTSYDLDAFSG